MGTTQTDPAEKLQLGQELSVTPLNKRRSWGSPVHSCQSLSSVLYYLNLKTAQGGAGKYHFLVLMHDPICRKFQSLARQLIHI